MICWLEEIGPPMIEVRVFVILLHNMGKATFDLVRHEVRPTCDCWLRCRSTPHLIRPAVKSRRGLAGLHCVPDT